MKYTLTFNNGIIYTSPDIREKDPGWASENGAKSVGIRELRLCLLDKRTLILRGFEAYNFFVEASQAFGKRGAKIESFLFCGRWQGHVVVYQVKMADGGIVKSLAQDGQEYCGTATRGWRMGVMGEKAESGVCLLQ